MKETKHDFIDDYPFIQYTDAPDKEPGGGGGGGSDIGSLQSAPQFYSGTIGENEEIDFSNLFVYSIAGFAIGNEYAVKSDAGIQFGLAPCIASGLDCIVTFDDTVPTIIGAYDVTIDTDAEVFPTATEISVTVTSTTVDWYTDSEEPVPALQFTMPELSNGHFLFFKVS